MTTIRASRATALALGLAILGWQAWNALGGAFVHRFLIADLALAAMLMIASARRGDRAAALAMIAAFSATAGVFLAATTGALLVDGYSTGRVLTGLGLLPCLVAVFGLTNGMARDRP